MNPSVLALGALLATGLLAPARALPPLIPASPIPAAADQPPAGLPEVRRHQGALALRELAPDHPDRAWFDALAESPPLRHMRGLLQAARRASGARRPTPDPEAPVVVCLAPSFRGPGPAFLADMPVDLDGRRLGGLILLTSLGAPAGTLDLGQLRASGTLPAILVHELTHQLMAECYGLEYWKLRARANPFARHEVDVATDPATAWIEGLAETMEVQLEDAHPGAVYRPAAPDAGPAARAFRDWMQRRRIDGVEQARYVFARDGRGKDGVVDPPQRHLATEGVVAAVLSRLLRSLGEDPPARLVELLATRRPRGLVELMDALASTSPEQSRVTSRVLLELTRYTTVSSGAAALYREAYLAGKAYKLGTGSLEAAQAARQTWEAFKARQRARVEAGVPTTAELVDPLELLAGDGQRVDLNTADPEALRAGLEHLLGETTAATVQALVLRRRQQRGGGLRQLRDLGDDLPEAVAQVLGAARMRALRVSAQRLHQLAERLRRDQQAAFFTGFADPRFGTTGSD